MDIIEISLRHNVMHEFHIYSTYHQKEIAQVICEICEYLSLIIKLSKYAFYLPQFPEYGGTMQARRLRAALSEHFSVDTVVSVHIDVPLLLLQLA